MNQNNCLYILHFIYFSYAVTFIRIETGKSFIGIFLKSFIIEFNILYKIPHVITTMLWSIFRVSITIYQ